jgi:hypothetical protein
MAFFWFFNFRKQKLVFMNENYDPAFFSCDHCIRKNVILVQIHALRDNI